MVFPFTLNGFPRKSGVLHFDIYFLVRVLFTYTNTIHIYVLSHIRYYSHILLLFIRRQQLLPESSIKAVEFDPSSSATSGIRARFFEFSMLCGCGC